MCIIDNFLISFRWPLVEQALLNPEILQSDDLIEAILSYNRSDRWNFDGLKCFLDECIEDEEKSVFYTTILPKVFRIAFFYETKHTFVISFILQIRIFIGSVKISHSDFT